MSDALKNFTEWFVKNYPGPNTIISKPEWHAPKIFRAATYELERENAALRKDAARYRWLRDLKCNSVTVGHDDENSCNYMTVEQWIDAHFTDDFSDVPSDEFQRMRDFNSIWSVQIYPDTPIGFVKSLGNSRVL